MKEEKIPAKFVKNEENARERTVWNQPVSKILILTKYSVSQVELKPL